MSPDKSIVLLAGLAAVAWINWYFFVAGRRAVATAAASRNGVQEIAIEVQGGYTPPTVRVRRGEPVRLIFDRKETSGCSEEVVLPAFGIRKFLPAFTRTAVEFTPPDAGRFEFTCGMGMLRGTLVVE